MLPSLLSLGICHPARSILNDGQEFLFWVVAQGLVPMHCTRNAARVKLFTACLCFAEALRLHVLSVAPAACAEGFAPPQPLQLVLDHAKACPAMSCSGRVVKIQFVTSLVILP